MKKVASQTIRSVVLTDETLISLVLSGHDKAYTLLVKRYEALMHSIVRGYLPNYEARQEIVQDTFLRAFRALPNFRAECKFSTWLGKIARTQAVDYLRKSRFDSWASIDDTLSQWEADLHSTEIALEKQESNQLIRIVMEQLRPEDAKAIELFYFFEQSLKEIEAITGWSANSIKTRLFRARHRLHSLLQKEGLTAEFFA